MPAPTQYNDLELARFMKMSLQQTAHDLTTPRADWITLDDTTVVSETPYGEPITEASVRYFGSGGHSIEEATDLRLLRIIARSEVWRAVMQATAGNYEVGGQSRILRRQQTYEHAVQQHGLAERDLTEYIAVTTEDEVRATTSMQSTAIRAKVVW
jgi:hypothetical protein